MPYIEETCVAGKTIEICKYHSARFGRRGEQREKREKPSSEAQKKCDQRRAIKDLRRLMNENFEDGDWLVRLDFHNAREIEGSKAMQELMQKMIRKLRAEFKKQGKVLKYIYVKEIGPKGGRHVHMMMSRTESEILRKCWPHGGIHIDPLYSGGQYAKIAEYFVKYAAKTEQTEGKLIGKRYYASRNLVRPQVKKRVVSANTFRKNIKKVCGYVVDKNSILSGISELTGFEYFSYTLIKAPPGGKNGNS